MLTLISGSLVISVLHAILPNHWLPVLAIAKKEGWSLAETTRITWMAAASHATSTVLLGLLLALLGAELSEYWGKFSFIVTPLLLILLGGFFIYQHIRHHHFHLHGHPEVMTKNRIVGSLMLTMFLSPCFEIEAYFLMAGGMGLLVTMLVAAGYLIITIAGMTLWIRLAYRGISRINWHTLEHNAGIITGITLIVSGVMAMWLK